MFASSSVCPVAKSGVAGLRSPGELWRQGSAQTLTWWGQVWHKEAHDAPGPRAGPQLCKMTLDNLRNW